MFRNTLNCLLLAFACAAAAGVASARAAAAQAAPVLDTLDVPARFEHDRVWFTPTVAGEPLDFFTDTGGGWNAIDKAVVERLGLAVQAIEADGSSMRVVAFPEFDAGQDIPPVPRYFLGGRLAVASGGMLPGGDGFLGGRWFADGIWAFDYGNGTLRRHLTKPDLPAAAGRVDLGFQVNAKGERTTHFPSMAIAVDGESFDVLLDTGATATLTVASATIFGAPVGTGVGTSFIEREVFERWVRRHPDWRMVERADRKGDQLRRMIEVPKITVAGFEVGPVWFAEQPPGAFQDYMAGMMDRPTWGALGGSGLKHFRVVIDYPGAAAWFVPLP